MPEVRLLLVEDSDTDAALVELELAGTVPGLEIHRVETGAQFAAALTRERPAIIVCDSRLPGLVGAEALERARHTWDTVPFVFFVGSLLGDPAFAAALQQADAVLEKSHIEELPALVKRLLS